MKTLATIIFSFIAGLFAPQYIGISHKSLSIDSIKSVDPIAVICVIIFLVGVSLLFKKRNGGLL